MTIHSVGGVAVDNSFVDPHVCEARMVGPMYIRSRPSALVGSLEWPRILKPSGALDPVVLTSLLVDHVLSSCLP